MVDWLVVLDDVLQPLEVGVWRLLLLRKLIGWLND